MDRERQAKYLPTRENRFRETVFDRPKAMVTLNRPLRPHLDPNRQNRSTPEEPKYERNYKRRAQALQSSVFPFQPSLPGRGTQGYAQRLAKRGVDEARKNKHHTEEDEADAGTMRKMIDENKVNDKFSLRSKKKRERNYKSKRITSKFHYGVLL